jgi:hypothetical protein
MNAETLPNPALTSEPAEPQPQPSQVEYYSVVLNAVSPRASTSSDHSMLASNTPAILIVNASLPVGTRLVLSEARVESVQGTSPVFLVNATLEADDGQSGASVPDFRVLTSSMGRDAVVRALRRERVLQEGHLFDIDAHLSEPIPGGVPDDLYSVGYSAEGVRRRDLSHREVFTNNGPIRAFEEEGIHTVVAPPLVAAKLSGLLGLLARLRAESRITEEGFPRWLHRNHAEFQSLVETRASTRTPDFTNRLRALTLSAYKSAGKRWSTLLVRRRVGFNLTRQTFRFLRDNSRILHLSEGQASSLVTVQETTQEGYVVLMHLAKAMSTSIGSLLDMPSPVHAGGIAPDRAADAVEYIRGVELGLANMYRDLHLRSMSIFRTNHLRELVPPHPCLNHRSDDFSSPISPLPGEDGYGVDPNAQDDSFDLDSGPTDSPELQRLVTAAGPVLANTVVSLDDAFGDEIDEVDAELPTPTPNPDAPPLQVVRTGQTFDF